MTQYFKLTPITEKPEKEGIYLLFTKGGYSLPSNEYNPTKFGDQHGGWLFYNNPERISHYLEPLPADTIVISEEKLRESLRQAHSNGLNRSPFIIENVIAELKAIAETSQTSPSQDRAK